MESLNAMFGIVYADWFIILMLLYMAIAPLILLRKSIPNAKGFFKKNIIGFLVLLFGFYFIFPVPLTVQEKEVEFVHNLVDNNDKVVKVNMQYWLSNQCNSNYLKGYQYFMFKKAFKKDFDATMDMQKMVNLGGIQDRGNYKGSYLCSLKF